MDPQFEASVVKLQRNEADKLTSGQKRGVASLWIGDDGDVSTGTSGQLTTSSMLWRRGCQNSE